MFESVCVWRMYACLGFATSSIQICINHKYWKHIYDENGKPIAMQRTKKTTAHCIVRNGRDGSRGHSSLAAQLKRFLCRVECAVLVMWWSDGRATFNAFNLVFQSQSNQFSVLAQMICAKRTHRCRATGRVRQFLFILLWEGWLLFCHQPDKPLARNYTLPCINTRGRCNDGTEWQWLIFSLVICKFIIINLLLSEWAVCCISASTRKFVLRPSRRRGTDLHAALQNSWKRRPFQGVAPNVN